MLRALGVRDPEIIFVTKVKQELDKLEKWTTELAAGVDDCVKHPNFTHPRGAECARRRENA